MIDNDRYVAGHIVSYSDRLSTAANVRDCIMQISASCGLEIAGYRDASDRVTPLPPEGLEVLLPVGLAGSVEIAFAPGHDIELDVHWIPPRDPVLELAPVDRTIIWCRVSHRLGWNLAERTLLSAVECADAFWAELNDKRITREASFAQWNAHVETVPHLGMANYFGAEYVEFFGGADRLEAAGFAQSMPFHKGLYVSLGSVSGLDEFVRTRAEIERRLASPGVFGAQRRGVGAPRFRHRERRNKEYY